MKKKNVLICFPEEIVEKLDTYAKKIGMPRNKIVNNLVNTGLDDLYILDKTGCLTLYSNLKKTRTKRREGQLELI